MCYFSLWLLIGYIILLNSWEDFVLYNSQSILAGYSLLTISQLNDPGIRALLIQTYNDLGGLRSAVTWTASIDIVCFSISNGSLTIGNSIQIATINGQITRSIVVGGIYQLTLRSTLNDLTIWNTATTCNVINPGPGIFGKNCGINNQVTLTKPGVYSYKYTSSEGPGTYTGNRAKYRIRFTIFGFTCFAPTITVKTFMGDYDGATEELLVTYVSNINSPSSIIEVDRCGDTNDFCDSALRPGNLCNIAGIQGSDCSRYVSCPQYYTPVNSWAPGSIREFIVSNGAEVHDFFNGCGTMNIEFILSCAFELIQINNGNRAYTS